MDKSKLYLGVDWAHGNETVVYGIYLDGRLVRWYTSLDDISEEDKPLFRERGLIPWPSMTPVTP